MQPIDLIEVGVKVFSSFGRQLTFEILLLIPGEAPIIFFQFLNPNFFDIGGFKGKKYLHYLKDKHIYLYHIRKKQLIQNNEVYMLFL